MKRAELSLRTIFYIFLGIWLSSVIGFHHSYTSKFTDFEGISWLQHFHGTAMMLWYVLLFTQLFLIWLKKPSWHRTIGKIGFVLGPIVVCSIFLITKMSYLRDYQTKPVEGLLAHLTIEIPLMVYFATFFLLAVIHRKRPSTHMRYMIATGLVMIGPGLGRAIIFAAKLHPIIAVLSMYLLPTVIAAIMLFNDYKNSRNTKPFKVITIILATQIVLATIQTTPVWQGFAKWFVESFFL